jgi:hypothetical protein
VTDVVSYAEWEYDIVTGTDLHTHVEGDTVTYTGTSGDCTICARPIQVARYTDWELDLLRVRTEHVDPDDELGEAPDTSPDEPEPVPDVTTDTVVDESTDITLEPGETVTITAPVEEEE